MAEIGKECKEVKDAKAELKMGFRGSWDCFEGKKKKNN